MPDPRRRVLTAPAKAARRPNSLVASAAVLSGPSSVLKRLSIKSGPWQKRAWDFYDNVGEFRFGAGWIGNGLSRVNIVGATNPEQQGDDPSALSSLIPDPNNDDDPRPGLTPVQQRAMELVDQIGGGPVGQGEMLAAFGLFTTVSGEAYLVAEPDLADPTADVFVTWSVVSDQEIRAKQGGGTIEEGLPGQADKQYEVVDEATGAWRSVHSNAMIIRIWRPHPARRSQADAPARGAFPVLQQIEMLTARIIADAQSRLAGAGLLVLPEDLEFPAQPKPDGSDPEDVEGDDDVDAFTRSLRDAMTTPIANRDSAAAVVPLIIKVPNDLVDKVTHLTFSTAFDGNLLELLDSAIKRLALALDMPPEVLTGMAGVNHWTAWQVEETAITLHIAPLAEMICQALTEGYLAPALLAEGFTADDIATVMVWYDTTDLQTRPDKSANVQQAYDRYEASGDALRREMGLDDEDAPDDDERRNRVLLDVLLKGSLNQQSIDLLTLLGYVKPGDIEAPAPPAPSGSEPPADEQPVDGPPQQEDQPPDATPTAIAAAGVLATADVIVRRALEKANAKLKVAAGRGIPGGAAAVSCPAGQQLHEAIGDVTAFASMDALLAGAWTWVPDAAAALDLSAYAFEDALNRYTRATLAGGMPHDRDRLAAALGLRPAAV